ncbi:MAG TPA: hypothetical protein VFV49_04095 [Thermoanaerobaculia bacterium]|nr:hypothetical protein [Thermoanaerobaculia bacterium]
MSPIIVTPPPVPPLGDPGSGAPPTLTVTFYQQLAAHFSAVLDEITAALPQLKPALVTTPQFVRTHLNIPLVFLGSAIASVEQLPELQAVKKLDPLEARDTLQLIEAFRPLRDKVAAFEIDLANVLNARQAALAVGALNTYDMVKSLARDPNNAPVAASLATLKRDLGRSGPRRKKDPVPDPKPVPVPVSNTPTAQTPEDAQG